MWSEKERDARRAEIFSPSFFFLRLLLLLVALRRARRKTSQSGCGFLFFADVSLRLVFIIYNHNKYSRRAWFFFVGCHSCNRYQWCSARYSLYRFCRFFLSSLALDAFRSICYVLIGRKGIISARLTFSIFIRSSFLLVEMSSSFDQENGEQEQTSLSYPIGISAAFEGVEMLDRKGVLTYSSGFFLIFDAIFVILGCWDVANRTANSPIASSKRQWSQSIERERDSADLCA